MCGERVPDVQILQQRVLVACDAIRTQPVTSEGVRRALHPMETTSNICCDMYCVPGLFVSCCSAVPSMGGSPGDVRQVPVT